MLWHSLCPLGTRRCYDVESASMTLIQRRNNVVCPVGYYIHVIIFGLYLFIRNDHWRIRICLSIRDQTIKTTRVLSLISRVFNDLGRVKCILYFYKYFL